MLEEKPAPEKTTRPGIGQAAMSVMVAGTLLVGAAAHVLVLALDADALALGLLSEDEVDATLLAPESAGLP